MHVRSNAGADRVVTACHNAKPAMRNNTIATAMSLPDRSDDMIDYAPH